MDSGTLTAQRDARGRFLPGNRCNPGLGRRPREKRLRDAFREYSEDALHVLVDVMNAADSRPADRLRACELILAYGVGRPVQQVEAEITDVRTLDLSQYTDDQLLALAGGTDE